MADLGIEAGAGEFGERAASSVALLPNRSSVTVMQTDSSASYRLIGAVDGTHCGLLIKVPCRVFGVLSVAVAEGPLSKVHSPCRPDSTPVGPRRLRSITSSPLSALDQTLTSSIWPVKPLG